MRQRETLVESGAGDDHELDPGAGECRQQSGQRRDRQCGCTGECRGREQHERQQRARKQQDAPRGVQRRSAPGATLPTRRRRYATHTANRATTSTREQAHCRCRRGAMKRRRQQEHAAAFGEPCRHEQRHQQRFAPCRDALRRLQQTRLAIGEHERERSSDPNAARRSRRSDEADGEQQRRGPGFTRHPRCARVAQHPDRPQRSSQFERRHRMSPRADEPEPGKDAAPTAPARSRRDSAAKTIRPLPMPPPMKLPAARASQLVCCHGLGP